MRYGVWMLAILGVLIASCSSTRTSGKKAVNTASEETSDGFEDALLTPAEDLNLKRAEIPKILKEIEQVYDLPRNASCSVISKEVKALTEVLGPDDDAPDSERASWAERVGKGAADLTLGVVSDTTGSLVPFRGLVRRATGATAHERRLRLAYQKGLQRRSFLKGVGHRRGCRPPAAPRPYPKKKK